MSIWYDPPTHDAVSRVPDGQTSEIEAISTSIRLWCSSRLKGPSFMSSMTWFSCQLFRCLKGSCCFCESAYSCTSQTIVLL